MTIRETFEVTIFGTAMAAMLAAIVFAHQMIGG